MLHVIDGAEVEIDHRPLEGLAFPYLDFFVDERRAQRAAAVVDADAVDDFVGAQEGILGFSQAVLDQRG